MTSKTETIKNRIAEVTASTRQYRRQYAPAKWQLQALEAAGLLEHMPAGFGNADADAVCKDARIGKFAKLETQGGAGDEVWTRTDAGLFFILSENDNDDDNDDPEEVARHTIGDNTIIYRNGDEYEMDAEWCDGPAAIWDHLPSRAEVEEVHSAATESIEQTYTDHMAESAILDELEQIMTAAEVAAEFGITERNVRKTCEDRRVKARKSGGTWLISRPDALRQWGKRGPREDWSDWRGPGWYGPRAEGQGWNIIRMYHLPWEYGESQYPTDDKSADTIHDVARFYNVGTPAYYVELGQKKD